MNIANLTYFDRNSLSNLHRNHTSLTNRTGAWLVIIYLVASVALLILLASSIYAHSTGRKLYLKAAIPAIATLVATIPLMIFGGIQELRHRRSKAELIRVMKSHILPHYRTHTKEELVRFIDHNLLQDWDTLPLRDGITTHNPKYKEWHRTYRDYLITQLNEAFKSEEENKVLLEALATLKQKDADELQKLAPQEE